MEEPPEEATIEHLKKQLLMARSEIKNLRQEIQTFKHKYRQDVKTIQEEAQNVKCHECEQRQEPIPAEADPQFRPIGEIRTVFNEKRAVPRQANLSSALRGRIELDPKLFSNPAHILEGLEEFSHIWIIYHFHRNALSCRSKVAPPRLEGKRVGVFSTRSPHRPCPIGLSLVQLDEIRDGSVYFLGTDMVDGTPVLDIKPYIPQYDTPSFSQKTEALFSSAVREAPDGEESVSEAGAVKVPDWVTKQRSLAVSFSSVASQQLKDLNLQAGAIEEVVSCDPRSVYLKTKYGSEVYNFQIGDSEVTCMFDDSADAVEVVQILSKTTAQEESGQST